MHRIWAQVTLTGVIGLLSVKTSPGPDHIPAKVIKE